MAGNTFGKLFRVTTAGVSHGPGYLCILDGCPAGLPLSVEDLLPDLARRKPGQSKLTTQRDESDTPEIWSGVFEGKTDGTPIGISFRNADQRSGDYGDIKDKYRPGHADYTFDAKYGFRDYRGGGRSSARETVCRVAAGAVAKKLLALHGVRVLGYVTQVGGVKADIPDPTAVTLEQVEASPTRCPVPETAAEMEALIDAVRKDRDSIGGVCEMVAVGVPPGLGEPVFDKLKADLGKAMLSLPAVTAFEYGNGFAVATMRGSENNDTFLSSGDPVLPRHEGERENPAPLRVAAKQPSPSIHTATNRHGGMLGGISSGMPVVCRVAIKPTSSIPRPQPTVTRTGEPTEILVKGRHDPCLLPRFVPMGEAMMALVLVDHLLRAKTSRLDAPGPDPLHTEPLAPTRPRKKRKRVPKPSFARVTAELVVVTLTLFAVVAFVPLSSRWFPWVCGAACVLAGGYAVSGSARRPGAAAWWGFTWGGKYEDELAKGIWNTALLFVASLLAIAVLKCLRVRTPDVLHPAAYLFWCVIQDFLFFSLILRGFERLTAGKLVGHQHLAVVLTAGLFGLSHFPMTGFMAVTALIGVFWGYIFLRTHLLWPITVLHFVLGLLVMS